MAKHCIFDNLKLCNNCNECNVCDLNPNKLCDDCGKCLKIHDLDTREVKIDQVAVNKEEGEVFEEELEQFEELNEKSCDNEVAEDNGEEVIWEYIEDIEGLKDVLEDPATFNKFACEEFPGLIKFNRK